jgi:hypothetical protein
MKKNLFLVFLLLLLVVGGLGTYVFFSQQPGPIGPKTFDKLKLGMTEAKIESIIGLPPGNYYTGPRGIGGHASRGPWGVTLSWLGLAEEKIPLDWLTENGHGTVRRWWGNKYAIEVAFGPQKTAVGIYLLEVVYPE